jgi:lipopolysaccharide export LptBFGC system permease protein LptF
MVKRIVLKVTQVIAGIAAVVFWLVPLRTGTQVLLFVASISVMLICFAVSSNLDDKANAGYWPAKPIDWSARQNGSDTDKAQTRDSIAEDSASSH